MVEKRKILLEKYGPQNISKESLNDQKSMEQSAYKEKNQNVNQSKS